MPKPNPFTDELPAKYVGVIGSIGTPNETVARQQWAAELCIPVPNLIESNQEQPHVFARPRNLAPEKPSATAVESVGGGPVDSPADSATPGGIESPA